MKNDSFGTRRRYMQKAFAHEVLDRDTEQALVRKVIEDREAWEASWEDDPFVAEAHATGKDVDWDEFWRREQVAAVAESRDPDMRKCWRNTPELNQLILCNIKLISSYATKWRSMLAFTNLSSDDAFSEAVLGFSRSVYSFDKARLGEIRLNTYATFWMRNRIQVAMGDQGSTIRLPAQKREVMLMVSRATRRFVAQHGREPEVDEIVLTIRQMQKERIRRTLKHKLKRDPSQEEMEPLLSRARAVDEHLVSDILEVRRMRPMSLDQDVSSLFGNGKDRSLISLIASTGEAADSSMERDDAVSLLEIAKQGLTSIESKIIHFRYFGDLTLQEVGEKYNLSRERIRQLQVRAERKLRVRMRTLVAEAIPTPPRRSYSAPLV